MSYPFPVSVIPGPNDALSLSQGQIQTNFANLIGWSGQDHIAYGQTNAGFHEQVTIPQALVSDPTLSSAITGEYYTKTVSSATLPFFAGWNGTATVVYPLVPTSTASSTGSITFGGGIQFAWARVAGIGNNGTFTVSSMTTVYQVTFTIEDSSTTPMSRCYISTIVGNVVTVKVPTGGTLILRYIAVGM